MVNPSKYRHGFSAWPSTYCFNDVEYLFYSISTSYARDDKVFKIFFLFPFNVTLTSVSNLLQSFNEVQVPLFLPSSNLCRTLPTGARRRRLLDTPIWVGVRHTGRGTSLHSIRSFVLLVFRLLIYHFSVSTFGRAWTDYLKCIHP